MKRLDRLLLLGLLLLKIHANAQVVSWGWDGGYYADVADNLARHGVLASSISAYHEAFVDFPTPTPVYPLWPALLGLVAARVPLDVAAVWLPTALALGAVWATMQATRRICAVPVLPDLGVDAGHVAGAVLGLNHHFFRYSSQPYTESLAMLLLALGLWRATTLLPRARVRDGVELGLWAASLLAVRGPWLPMVGALGVGAALPLLLRRPGVILGFGPGLALGLAPILLWLRHVPGATLEHLVFFERWRVRPGLSTYAQLVPAQGPWSFMRDRAAGLEVAWTGPGPDGWTHSVGLIAFAPIAVVLFRPRRAWGAARVALREPTGHPPLLALGIGGALALALHGVHKLEGAEWNFGTRHALGALPLFVGASLWLLSQGGWARALSGFALCATLGTGLLDAVGARDALRFARPARETWARLGALAANHRVVAANECQVLVRFAPDIGCVELQRYTTPEDLDWMVREQGVSLMIRSEKDLLTLPGPGWQPVVDLPDGFVAFEPGV